ncbi:MAG: hypothetical protein NZ956_00410 [Candidatus Caldarchaeum sp.]|nr:hypothetical protein [Candidatus Caldarchaeum sp.]
MIDKALRLAALFPPVLITAVALSRIDISNPFVLVGMFSLIFISATDRFKWAGVVFVYVPAIYTVYLLLTGTVSPFLGLAAGYIISTPYVLAISAYRSPNVAGLITGYYTSYLFALLLYGAVAGGNIQPERLFLTLIRNLLGIASLERVNMTPATPEPSTIYNSLAAVATFSLLACFAAWERVKPTINTAFIKSLLAVVAVLPFVVFASDFSPATSSFLLLGSSMVVLAFLAVKMRWRA